MLNKKTNNKITIEGYSADIPYIKKLKFDIGKIGIYLQDGRIIISSLKKFPSIKKLSLNDRKKYQILDGIGFTFRNSNELFHISQFVGENNAYD